MKHKILDKSNYNTSLKVLAGIASAKFLFHVVINATTAYGYFRDEFYYIACSEHLAWGYVDQPPLSVFFLKISRFFLGDSLVALRILPALAGAMVIFITGMLVLRLGGNLFAVILASVAVFIAPIFLAMNGFYSMNSFDHFFWISTVYLLVLIIQKPSLKLWIGLGIILGLGLLNKVSVLWLGAGIFAGLLLTSHRKLFLTKGPWVSAGIALLLFLPHLIWQIQFDWPTLEFIQNASANKYVENSIGEFMVDQILIMHPFNLLIWLPGLAYFLFHPKGKNYRFVGIIYLTVFLILVLNKTSKAEYLAPAYPMLLAGGAVMISIVLKNKFLWLKALLVTTMILLGGITAPMGVPILPVESYLRYAETLGIAPTTSEKKELGVLPQFYADMHGWENLAKEISGVYQHLSEEEKARCVFYGNNYGQAGAIEFYSSIYPLPPAVSGHNNCWLWGPGNLDQESIVIIAGSDLEDYQEIFEKVTQKGFVHSTYAMPYENNLPVYVCRETTIKNEDFWLRVKHYN